MSELKTLVDRLASDHEAAAASRSAHEEAIADLSDTVDRLRSEVNEVRRSQSSFSVLSGSLHSSRTASPSTASLGHFNAGGGSSNSASPMMGLGASVSERLKGLRESNQDIIRQFRSASNTPQRRHSSATEEGGRDGAEEEDEEEDDFDGTRGIMVPPPMPLPVNFMSASSAEPFVSEVQSYLERGSSSIDDGSDNDDNDDHHHHRGGVGEKEDDEERDQDADEDEADEDEYEDEASEDEDEEHDEEMREVIRAAMALPHSEDVREVSFGKAASAWPSRTSKSSDWQRKARRGRRGRRSWSREWRRGSRRSPSGCVRETSSPR